MTEPAPKIADIQAAVAAHFRIKLADMTSPRRARCVARPRQIAMYLSREFTTASLPGIGRAFGYRDHTTIMHGIGVVEGLTAKDKPWFEGLQILRQQLRDAEART